MTAVRRLNHAVLWVADLEPAVRFYTDVLGFEIALSMGDQAAFLRAAGSDNDHDLGLFARGASAPRPPQGATGLYHLAWQVDTIDDLAAMRTRLLEASALVGESDHAVSKSVYGVDPAGNEFEVMWAVPADAWGDDGPTTRRLDLAAELERWTGVSTR